jgi:hypothetical protein
MDSKFYIGLYSEKLLNLFTIDFLKPCWPNSIALLAVCEPILLPAFRFNGRYPQKFRTMPVTTRDKCLINLIKRIKDHI